MSASTEIQPGEWAASLDPRRLREPREAALWVVERALANREPGDALRRRVEGRLEARDRALLHQLVTGVLRWLLRLDHAVVSVSGRELAAIDSRLLGPLRLGTFQLLFLDRVPTHAVVDTSVELAKRRSPRGAGFVNAVLRKMAAVGSLDRLPVEGTHGVARLAIETSHPAFLVERWSRFFGLERTRQLLAANNRDRRASLLVTGGNAARERLIGELAGEGVRAVPSTLSPLGLLVEEGGPLSTAAFSRGDLHPQDEASQCAALVPPPRPGERILDAAAAPGGKTLSLLAWEPTLRIVAADSSVPRLASLVENRRRCGQAFDVLVSDAREPALAGGFDRVIADLPCTGTGTIRKHPEIKWRLDDREIRRLTDEAAGMLDGLAPLVAPGGLLVVSTCSIEPEENEQQIERFLERHPGFEMADLSEGCSSTVSAGLETPDRWRLLPGEEHDGFTVHALRLANNNK